MNLLDKIKKQPEHIREIFMWLLVVIVFSFVLLTGFRQTERNLALLVNPEQDEKTTELASDTLSSLASFGGYFKDLSASVADIFRLKNGAENGSRLTAEPKTEISPILLPLEK